MGLLSKFSKKKTSKESLPPTLAKDVAPNTEMPLDHPDKVGSSNASAPLPYGQSPTSGRVHNNNQFSQEGPAHSDSYSQSSQAANPNYGEPHMNSNNQPPQNTNLRHEDRNFPQEENFNPAGAQSNQFSQSANDNLQNSQQIPIDKMGNSNQQNMSQPSNSMDSDDFLFDFPTTSRESLQLSQEQKLKNVSNKKNEKDFSFSENDNLSQSESPFYIASQEYEKLLEIIKSVKDKVKKGSDVYLKLLDIKAQEDVEYDNLQKTFSYIEEKLYDADTLIFER